MEPDRRRRVQKPVRGLNWTLIALIGGLVLLILLIAYFATRGNSNQDKLINPEVSSSTVASHEKLCASKATYDLIKRELFRRAAQLRGSDQAAYDKLSAYAVARMENPVLESEDSSTGAVNCSGSLSIDLPPGVTVAGGRHTLTSDLDYTIRPAAGASGAVVLLRNADAIITPLATLAQVAQPAAEAPGVIETNEGAPEQPESNAAASESASKVPGPATAYPARPSFDCVQAHSRGEMSVCEDSGLAALDLNMAAEYAARFRIGVARTARPPPPDRRSLLALSRSLSEPPMHRRCLCGAHAGNPGHHGKPRATPKVIWG